MTRKNLPIAFYLLLVFVSGSVVGALGYRTYNPPTARGSVAPPPSEWRRNYIDESRTRLNLTDDQVAKLTAILDQTEARFREAREDENKAIGQIRDEHVERVRTILTPEQLPKYVKLHQEREERAKQQEQKRR
jgi:Spy/CpxP family protein refolding chaperone